MSRVSEKQKIAIGGAIPFNGDFRERMKVVKELERKYSKVRVTYDGSMVFWDGMQEVY
ncbi:hypothetical protein [Priestia filamentosa]|uniref:hypothetical protein n=1 Tax=Priestia filamentosa TaxID=1402861 RepID=UPI000A7B5603|nr:hypothetical protein [Priestia filamentosa]